ncbi:disease resistance protein RGA5-like [Phragmites australis]|uniref:disease resistance protein RGA5-like n=1 Tax=Phragmites australis TaxID=29695 RepID=UPI002D765745|nr:disease resistance protein RGA5-like [Phragmites australis]
MRTEMVIRMQGNSSEKGHSKAMKIAAEIEGVESVTLAGKDRDLLLVVGDGVDCNYLTTRLRRKLGHADIVELRTLHDSGRGGGGGGYGNYSSPVPSSYTPAASEYYHHQPYEYYHPPPYAAAVVHHEYYPAAADPNSCSIM